MDDREKYVCFYNHCKEGNIEKVERILSSGMIDPNSDYFRGLKNLLVCAVNRGKTGMVKILLKYGVNVNIGSPLHLACKMGINEIAELLINSGAGVNCLDGCSRRPLDYAVKEKRVRIVKLLLEKGAKFHKNIDGTTILRYFKGNYNKKAMDIIKLLLDHNIARIELLFSHALTKRNVPLVKLLIGQGIDVDGILEFRSKSHEFAGRTPLTAACSLKYNEIVYTLLKSGANPNMQDNYGFLPLFIGESFDDLGWMKQLLRFGADINLPDQNGYTALHNCCTKEIMTFLFCHGFTAIDYKNFYQRTARNFLESISHVAKWLALLEHHDKCVKEISRMKNIALNNYGLNAYDILFMNIHELSRYVNNVRLKKIVKAENFSKKFTIFGERLKEKYEQGEKRKDLIKNASESLEKLIGLKVPELISHQIFKYFLNRQIEFSFLTVSNK